jgi:hypothetical protein
MYPLDCLGYIVVLMIRFLVMIIEPKWVIIELYKCL